MVTRQDAVQILNNEMELATGCTEPAAIALTAAYAGSRVKKLGDEIQNIRVDASTNMIKNAISAGIPGTSYTGIEYAAAIGALGGNPDCQLQVINEAEKASFKAAEELVKSHRVTVDVADIPEKLYISITVQGMHHTAHAVIAQMHTNLVLLETDGSIEYENRPEIAASAAGDTAVKENPAEKLTVADIFEFIDRTWDPVKEPIRIIQNSIDVNTAICKAGLEKGYGLEIGPTVEKECEQGIRQRDMATNAIIITSAGADARMAGAPYSVVTNSGSGNQGITTTMPVVACADWLKCPEDKKLRAVALSNLVAIHIKTSFGRLSALCGATVAGTGAACGITYLLGGGLKEVGYAIQNMIGNVTGMLCDGAKADCSLKISTCVNAAVQAALMAKRGFRVQNTDGIVETDVEKTISNFSELGNKGSAALDKIILKMMLDKQKQ